MQIKYFEIFILFTLFSYYSKYCYGLQSRDSDSVLLSTTYNKSFTIHNFNNEFYLSKKVLDNLIININEKFNSTLLKTSINNIRDNNILKIDLSYLKFDKLKLISSVLSNYFIDNRNIGINDIADNSLQLAGEYAVIPEIEITLKTGYKQDRQFNIIDEGIIYGIGGKITSLNFYDYILTSNSAISFENIGERTSYNNRLNMKFEKSFTSEISDKFEFTLSDFKKNYYFSIDSMDYEFLNKKYNIDERKDLAYSLNNELKIDEIVKNLKFRFLVDVYYRKIDKTIKYHYSAKSNKNLYDEYINEFRVGLSSELSYHSDLFKSNLIVNYNEREEQHSLTNSMGLNKIEFENRVKENLAKNNFNYYFQISNLSQFVFSQNDEINFQLQYSILKYNTPLKENYDDRDELFTGLSIEYLRKVFSNFEIRGGMDILLKHLVYLYSEKSSNNNWNRLIHLYSNTSYKNYFIRTSNTFELAANYLVYDYRDIITNLKGVSSRQLSFSDSTVVFLSHIYFLDLNFTTKLSEQGFLNWENFSVNLQRFKEEYFGEFSVGRMLNKYSELNLGMRMFLFNEFNYKGSELQKISSTRSIGPFAGCNLIFNNDFKLVSKFWIEYIYNDTGIMNKNINIFINSEYRF